MPNKKGSNPTFPYTSFFFWSNIDAVAVNIQMFPSYYDGIAYKHRRKLHVFFPLAKIYNFAKHTIPTNSEETKERKTPSN